VTRCALALLSCVLVAASGLADPSPAYLVKDIRTNGSNGPDITRAIASNGRAFLFLSTPETGYEVWTSDGTPAGTQLVKVIDPNSSYTPSHDQLGTLTDLGGIVLFRMNDGPHGYELWKSDGTAAGTTLVKDICPNLCPSWPILQVDAGLTRRGGAVYFMAEGFQNGTGLWKSDGTEAGTVLVKSLSAGSSKITNVNGALFFTAKDASGVWLWKSDGEPGGTVPVKQIAGPGSVSQYFLTNVNGTLFFVADDGVNGRELWTSDGTPAGTAMVLDIAPGSGGSIADFTAPLASVGGTVFFVANDGVNGTALWKSDGTAAGTVLVSTAGTSIATGNPFSLTEAGGTLYFVGTDAANGSELWKSDGTGAGTVLVKNIASGTSSSGPTELTNVGGTLFFNAYDAVNGRELWKSDGTAAGTVMVKSINPGIGYADPQQLANVNGTLFFSVRINSNELWKSDGTAAGTVALTSLTGTGDSSPGVSAISPDELAAFNGELFFPALASSPQYALWKSDGTSAGTSAVLTGSLSSTIGSFAELNGLLLFRSGADFTGAELYKSDGTPAGSGLVKEIRTGTFNGSDPDKLTKVNGTVFFTANDGTNGTELWKTDGTTAGTVLVKDVTAGAAGTSFGSLVDFDGTLFFGTNTDLWKSDGTAAGTVVVSSADAGTMKVVDHTLYISAGELWKSDGTSAGTVLVRDILTSGNSSPYLLTNVGSTLFFRAQGNGGAGQELWKSDGTAAGTVLVKDINPGVFSSNLQKLVNADGTLFFVADDGVHGAELWKSNGTAAGTVLVKDVWPGNYSLTDPTSLTAVGPIVVFSADDGVFGTEVWISDGTSQGTRRLADIAPIGSSSPHGFTRVGDLLFFRALTNATGHEPYAVPVAVLTDADLDGLLDADERALGTDEFQADTDNDGLSDGDEVHTHGTNPLLADSDGDGYSDGAEIQAGTDPLDAQSVPPPVPVAGPWLYVALTASLLAVARQRLGAISRRRGTA
jgi:ELWxxDGT repeat protein